MLFIFYHNKKYTKNWAILFKEAEGTDRYQENYSVF